jgi:hypothetical protein
MPPEEEPEQEYVEPLEIISALDLYNKAIPALKFFVAGILPQGLTLLVAPSKYGKSWWSLELVLCVAGGWDFLSRATKQCEALYLALEDGYRRLKSRQDLILQGQPPPPGVYFTVRAKTIDQGLSVQIERHMKAHPRTGVVVIDVLQRVRSSNPARGQSAYALDYSDMGALKAIADKHQIAVLLVHHDRKMKDESDPFNKISGTNGIMGAADTIMLITKKDRSDGRSVLRITGRDVESVDLVLEHDLSKTYRWHVVTTVEQEEKDKERAAYENNPVIKTIKGMLAESPLGVERTANEIKERMPEFADTLMSAHEIGHAINRLETDLYNRDKIIHKRTKSGKIKHLFRRAGVVIKFKDADGAEEEDQ